MAWLVFCRHCNVPFEIDKSTIAEQDGNKKQELNLICPFCHKADVYTAQDVAPAAARA